MQTVTESFFHVLLFACPQYGVLLLLPVQALRRISKLLTHIGSTPTATVDGLDR